MDQNRKKRIAYPILEALLSFFAIFFMALGFSDNSLSQQFATSGIVSKLNSNNNDFFPYSSIMRSLEDGTNITNNYSVAFRSDANHLRVISYLNQEGDVARVKISGENHEYSSTFAVCNAGTYSNTAKFENHNISLFKNISRDQTLSIYGTNGFVFIPDYLADEMIESSNGELKTYDDIVPDYSAMSEEEIASFLEKHALTLTNSSGSVGRYKISNIFRVKGFNEAYMNGREMPEETTVGDSFESFFGHYVFMPSRILFNEDEAALFSLAKNKQYSIYYDISTICSLKTSTNQQLACYVKGESGYSRSDYYSSLMQNAFISYVPRTTYTVILVIGVIFMLSAIALMLYAKSSFLVEPKTHLWNVLFVLAIATVLNIVGITFGSTSLAFLSFNNIICASAILAIMGFSAYCYFSEKKRWRRM